MIFYFSATGNSRWVARQLAARLGDEAYDIVASLRAGWHPAVPVGAKRVGVVYPTHCWYVPAPALDFLSQMTVPPSVYRYAVCTCGDDVGKGLSRLSRHFPLDAAWSVQMPNTYVPMFDLDAPELARRKVADAAGQLAGIAEAVEQGKKVWKVSEGSCAWLKTYVVYPLFERFYVGIRAFRVDEEACISCGKCEKNCPVSAIHLAGGHPVWNEACIHCMACLHGCPVHAISYGKSSKAKGQYRLEDYLARL